MKAKELIRQLGYLNDGVDIYVIDPNDGKIRRLEKADVIKEGVLLS